MQLVGHYVVLPSLWFAIAGLLQWKFSKEYLFAFSPKVDSHWKGLDEFGLHIPFVFKKASLINFAVTAFPGSISTIASPENADNPSPKSPR